MTSMRTALCFFFALLAAVVGNAQTAWKAGVGKVSVTPQEPIWLSGYANRTKPSEEVVQEIFVKALALEDSSGGRAVIVTSDLQGFGRATVAAIHERARAKHGLKPDQIILNYSHNHSAPVTEGVLDLYYDLDPGQKAVVARYTAEVVEAVDRVIGLALADLKPAQISFGQGVAGIAVNRRRVRPGARHLPGPTDPDVPVLAVRGPEGALRAVLFGYACHNTALGRYQISGDYAGWAQAEIEKTYPGTVALFLMGCGGDSNPLPRYQGADPRLAHYGMELASMYGKILAAAVDLTLHEKMESLGGPLRTALGSAELPFEQVPARAELEARLRAARTPKLRREVEYLLGVLNREGKLPERVAYPVQVWRWGAGLTLIALTGEPVVDYSLRFKKQYGWERTWVAGYSNELLAYIPSLRVLKEGGYEGREGVSEYGLPAPFGEAVEEVIARKVEELMRATQAVGREPGLTTGMPARQRGHSSGE